MTLADLMAELGERMEIGAFELDFDGGTQIVLDDETVIDIEPDPDGGGFHFYARIGPMPQRGREPVMAALLAANRLGQDTGAAALALDRDLDEIVLCRMLDEEGLSFDQFEAALTEFAAVHGAWAERLSDGAIGTRPDVSDDPAIESGRGISGAYIRG